jgi:cytoskeletal protein CcmA (bactofilin family)
MTVTVANTELLNSFDAWRLNTNFIATVISNNVVTVSGTGQTARGGTATGDGHVNGQFSASNLSTPILSGGIVGNPGPISITSNTTIVSSVSDFTVDSDATLTSNVNFTITGENRMILPSVEKIRVGGGSGGQVLRIEQNNEPHFKDFKLRDLQGDHAFELTHNDLTLAGGNTAFRDDGNSPHLVFSGGVSNNDVVSVYLAGAALTGDSDLYIKLVDSFGDSALVITDSGNTVVATVDSDGNAHFTNGLNVDGVTTLNSTSTTTLTANGATNLESTLDVDGGTTLNAALDVDGATTLNSSLDVDGATSLNALTATTLTANGATNLESTLDVDGGTTLNSTLDVDGGTTLNAALDVDGATTLNSTLDVDGASTLNGLTVTTLTANGATNLESTLDVDGGTTLNSTLDVDGGTTLNSTLDVDLATTLNSTLDVDGASTLHNLNAIDVTANGNLIIKGSANLQITEVTSLGANGAVDFTSTLNVDGSTTLNELTTTTLTANAAVDLKTTLNVDGDTSLNALTATTLTANGVVNLESTLDVDGGTTLNAALDVDGATTLNSSLDVDGATSLNDVTATTLTANGNVVIKGSANLQSTEVTSLTANSTVNFHEGAFFANGNVTFGTDRTAETDESVRRTLWESGALSTLTIFANTVFKDNVTIPAGITTEASGAFGSITVTGASLLNGAVTVGNDAADVISIGGEISGAVTHSGGQLFNASGQLAVARIGSGTIASGKLSNNLVGDAGTYGSSTVVPSITVNSKGLITAISNNTIAGLSDFSYTVANTTLRITSTDSTEFDVDLPVTQAVATSALGDDVLGLASFNSSHFAVTDGWAKLKNATTGAVLGISGTTNEVEVSRSFGTVTVGLPDDVSVAGQLSVGENVVITGNLTVSGTTTTVNTTEVNIADNMLVLNSDVGENDQPSEDSGFTVNRGAQENVVLRWTENTTTPANSRWQLSANNADFYDILTDNEQTITDRTETTSVDRDNDYVLLYDASETGHTLRKASVANVAAAGLKGQKGATGAKGIDGVIGVDGTKGDTGAKGADGADGADGTKGDTGAKGAPGSDGVIGVDGDKGDTGAKGADGADGGDGAKGAPGAKGAQGDKGVLDFHDSEVPTEDKVVFYNENLSSHDYGTLGANLKTDGDTIISRYLETDGVTFNNASGSIRFNDNFGSPGANTDINVDIDGRYIMPFTVQKGGDYNAKYNATGVSETATFDVGGDWSETDTTNERRLYFASKTFGRVNSSATTDDPDFDPALNTIYLPTTKIGIDNNGTAVTPLTGNFHIGDGTGISIGASVTGSGISSIYRIGVSLENDRRTAGDQDVYVGNNDTYTFYDSNVIKWYTGGNHEMSLDNSGDLFVDNDVIAMATSLPSDERLKENIQVVEGALDKVCALRGVTFDWKKDGKSSAGLIAQELEKVLPSAVKERTRLNSDEEMKTVDYNQLTALFIESIKELKAENEELRAMVEELKG